MALKNGSLALETLHWKMGEYVIYYYYYCYYYYYYYYYYIIIKIYSPEGNKLKYFHEIIILGLIP